MYVKTLSTAAVLAVAAATAASAAPVLYATGFENQVVGANQDPGRADPNAALGTTTGDIYELGSGGSIDFTFGQLFTGPALLLEVTFGDNALFAETTDVFGVLDGVATLIDTFTNDDIGEDGELEISFSGIYDALRFTDVTALGPDVGQVVSGIDIDTIAVSPIPVPAAGLLLVGALGALGLARRRAA